jgi:hypothetical protein
MHQLMWSNASIKSCMMNCNYKSDWCMSNCNYKSIVSCISIYGALHPCNHALWIVITDQLGTSSKAKTQNWAALCLVPQTMINYISENWQKSGDSESDYDMFVSVFIQSQFAKYTKYICFSSILQYSGLKMDF